MSGFITGGAGGVTDLQGAYDGGSTITIAASTPVALTTAGTTEDGLTVTDGSAALSFRGNGVLLPDGAVGTPSARFSSDPGTGLYLVSANRLGIVTGGGVALQTSRQLSAATGNEVGTELTHVVNKATSGNYTALLVNVTETAAPGTDDRLLDLQVGGASQMYVSNSGNVLLPDGTSGAPALAFAAHLQAGVYFGASKLNLALGGAVYLGLGGGVAQYGAAVQIQASGTKGATETAICFGTDTDTGFYAAGADIIGYAAGGTGRYTMDAASFSPVADNTYALGTASLRFSTLYSATLNTGDINMRGLFDDAHWTLNESRTGIYAHDRKTGKVYRLAMTEVDPSEAPPVYEREAA